MSPCCKDRILDDGVASFLSHCSLQLWRNQVSHSPSFPDGTRMSDDDEITGGMEWGENE